MNSEQKLIEVTAGPYKGQRIKLGSDDAEAAISEGWAVDPFAPPSDEPPKELSAEERQAINDKAERAAERLRGEKDESEAEPDKPQPAEAKAEAAPPPRKPEPAKRR